MTECPISQSQIHGLVVYDLGRLRYRDAMAVQHDVHRRVVEGVDDPTLLLVEHPPVITISRRPGVERHILAERHNLERLGIEVESTDRGGDVTYHGPGQLVAYPIVRLGELCLNIGRYMRLLEQTVIKAINTFGVVAHCEPGLTGVWANDKPGSMSRKLCALGVRVKRGVTLHGLALNVDPNLNHFETIVPCGLAHRGVTSLREILADDCPTINTIKVALAAGLCRCLARKAGSQSTAYP